MTTSSSNKKENLVKEGILQQENLQKIAEKAAHLQKTHTSSQRLKLPLKIGTRASPLALVQTRNFITRLTRFCPVLRENGAVEEVRMTTTGDQNLKDRLAEIGGKGLFSKEIHEQLALGGIDIAVHSLKDLETHLPPNIVLAGTMKREDARDVLILRKGWGDLERKNPHKKNPYDMLPEGALVGCASVRRQAQLLHQRPDIRFCLLRGNVQTRLDKLNSGQCDATFLALAGLKRLGMEDRADYILEPQQMLPASGQGIVGVTARENDYELRELLSSIEDLQSRFVANAERALLAELDGSCRTPIGGYAEVRENILHLTGLVAAEDGSFLLRREIKGNPKDAILLGQELGRELRRDTPSDIFARITQQ